MTALVEGVVALLIVTGGFFSLAGSAGMVRFADFFRRIHGPTKATTLGVGALLLASTLYFSWQSGGLRPQELVLMVFLFMTAPVSAHLLAKAALHFGVASVPPAPRKRTNAPGWDGAAEAARRTED